MELFGIGPLELIFIFIIILLVIGPKDIEKTSRNLGKMINRVNRSPNFQVVRRASEELRNLPARLAREAQLDELKELTDMSDVKKELQETANTIGNLNRPFEAWTKDLSAPSAGQALKAGETPPATSSPGNGAAPAQESASTAAAAMAPADPSSAAPPTAVLPTPVPPPSDNQE